MKIRITVGLLLMIAGLSHMAHAADSPVTPIENATMKCTKKGVLVAFDIEKARLWKGDKTQAQELSNVRADRLRCVNCFDLRGELTKGDQKFELAAKTRTKIKRKPGRGGGIKRETLMSFSLTGSDGKVTENAELKCSK